MKFINKEALLERLLSHRTIDSNGCWIYNNDPNNYGCIRNEGGVLSDKLNAHVLSAQLYFDNYDPSLFVLHKCDVRGCFNPDHLFQGTQSENIQDCVSKGRQKEIRKTHCARGHEFNEVNTKINKRGKRVCQICKKDNDVRYRVTHGLP